MNCMRRFGSDQDQLFKIFFSVKTEGQQVKLVRAQFKSKVGNSPEGQNSKVWNIFLKDIEDVGNVHGFKEILEKYLKQRAPRVTEQIKSLQSQKIC